jgi:hypothetical protein
MEHRTTFARTCGPALRLTALLVVLALAGGVRPRVLAQEHGPVPSQSSVCLLCDGSATAATVAPSVESAAVGSPQLVLLVPSTIDVTLDQRPALASLAAVTPPPPPPRA